jgi:hypothetical protein
MHSGASDQGKGFWQSYWPERIASFIAFLGVVWAELTGFNVRLRQNAASDFKTLYASAWCFARRIDAYSFREIARVFDLSHVVQPRSWYAHAPVYPPFTLAFLAPLTLIPMVPAIYLWILLSALAIASAAAALAQVGGETLKLGRPWRITLIVLAAVSPLVSAGLELGNVSVLVGALCILAAITPQESDPWLPAVVLAAAILLKPHIAIWVLVAFAFLRTGRRIAIRSCGLCTAMAIATVLWAATQHKLFAQIESYRSMLASELSNGSMAIGNHQVLELIVQITSLESLFGYWFPYGILPKILATALLLIMAAVLVWSSWRLRSAKGEERLCVIGSWCAFGIVATYHRAPDGIVLLLILVVVMSRLQRSAKDIWGWSMFIAMIAASFGPSLQTLQQLTGPSGINIHWQFLLFRQAALANFLLACLLLMMILRMARESSSSPRSTMAHP